MKFSRQMTFTGRIKQCGKRKLKWKQLPIFAEYMETNMDDLLTFLFVDPISEVVEDGIELDNKYRIII
jgi:hypothetical protein